MSISTYKVLLAGNTGVGKTTMLKYQLTGYLEHEHIPTIGVDVHPLELSTRNGTVCLNVWDLAGMEKFGGLRGGYYVNADAAIIIGNTNGWLEDIQRIANLSRDKIVTSERANPQLFQQIANLLTNSN